MVKVLKFGGTSLANAEQFKKVADIIKAEKDRRYVIASAPGKRFSDDIKVTDLLISCAEALSDITKATKIFEEIEARYNAIIADLGLDFSLENDFEIIKSKFSEANVYDYIVSRGEYLNSKILAKYLGYKFIDAADCIFFGEDGKVNFEKTYKAIIKFAHSAEYAVFPGFYGSNFDGNVKIFSRGGSDITGSIVAAAIGADIYENWTDVSGFLMVDPRIVDNPMPIEEITYRELRELSYMGATVLHEESVFPVRRAGIPINIRNTNQPDAAGTLIVKKATKTANKSIITGIAGMKGFSAIYIEKDMMNGEIGFTRKVLEILEKRSINFEHLPSGIDTMTIVLKSDYIVNCEHEVLEEIAAAVNPDSLYVYDHLALVAVVGHGMQKSKGTASKLFSALANANINIRMIDQGSSELNIIVGINEEDYESAIKAIYNKFVFGV